MAVRSVVRLPETVLRVPTAVVTHIDDGVRTLCDDLLETMASSPACVGLAANQVGVGLRVAVVDVTGHKKADSCHGAMVLINPVVVRAEMPVIGREGCMSVPDLTGNVARATRVTVQSLDVDGRECVIDANAFEARALLHEIDHLDGKTFLDRVSSFGADVFKRKRYR
jgi:peptide deformylase